MFTRLRALRNPDMYQGWGRRRNYFEGWYFKLVDAAEQNALAFIPGISMDKAGNKHAFVQVMNGTARTSAYHRIAAESFEPSDRRFELNLGDNFFSSSRLQLDLPDYSGELYFHETQPWPKMLGAPGIMGWYSYVPFMECNHGIVSLNHRIEGVLQGPDGTKIDFTGGRGYIEKDWGYSFPRAYVWMQSNHFDTHDRASLFASTAHIPWMGSYFIGFIAGFWLDGRLFRFATYTGAKKSLIIGESTVELVFQSTKTELRLFARQAPGAELISPLSGAMTGKINESLQAEIAVELLEKGQRIFEGNGRNAGLELAGALEVLTNPS